MRSDSLMNSNNPPTVCILEQSVLKLYAMIINSCFHRHAD